MKNIFEKTQSNYDMVDINTLIPNPWNEELYGSYDEKHIEDLQASIMNDGFRTPITLYNDKKTINAGHNRFLSVKGLGYDEIPAVHTDEEVPTSALKAFESLSISNIGRKPNLNRQYNSVKKMIEAYENEKGVEAKPKDVKGFCTKHNLGYESYNFLSKNEYIHPDIFAKIMKGLLTIEGAKKVILQITNGNSVSLNKSPYMKDLITKDCIDFAISNVTIVLNEINGIECKTPKSKKVFYPAKNLQKNTRGALVHEVFTNSIAEYINDKYGKEIMTAPKNQDLYDLEVIKYNSGIEIKTCVTDTGKKPRWVTHRYKDGYTILLSLTPNYTRAFCGYGVIHKDTWKPGGGQQLGTLIVDELYGEKEFQSIIGSVEEEKSKIVVQHNQLIIK